MDERVLRVGVTGLGFGASVHVPALRGLPGVEVVAIAGRSRHKAAAVAKRLNIANACVGVEELLEFDLDAVTLALPPKENETAAAMALDRGLPLFSEKPIARSVQAANRLVEQASGIPTVVDFEFAELETFRALKALLMEERLGAPRHAQLTWLVESRAQKHRAWGWKTDAEAGGGAMALLGSHALFLAEGLFGPIMSIQAVLNRHATASFAPRGRKPADDLAYLWIVHQNEFFMNAIIGNANPGCSIQRWTVVCDEGTAVLENPGRDYIAGFTLKLYQRDKSSVEFAQETASSGDGRINPVQRMIRRWVETIRSGTLCETGLLSGARVQSLLCAARESALKKKGISVEPR